MSDLRHTDVPDPEPVFLGNAVGWRRGCPECPAAFDFTPDRYEDHYRDAHADDQPAQEASDV